MSDPSADEKRLAELRADDGGITRDDFLFIIRLLDAAQARLKDLEHDVAYRKKAERHHFDLRMAAEERASSLAAEVSAWAEQATSNMNRAYKAEHLLHITATLQCGYKGEESDVSANHGAIVARLSALAAALTEISRTYTDVENREAIHFQKIARAALSSTTSKCPQDSNAPQAAESHESGNKS